MADNDNDNNDYENKNVEKKYNNNDNDNDTNNNFTFLSEEMSLMILKHYPRDYCGIMKRKKNSFIYTNVLNM